MKLEKGRSYIADILEDLAGDIITLTGCKNMFEGRVWWRNM